MRWRKVNHYCSYLLARVVCCIIQALPLETCTTVAGGLAVLAMDVLRIRRRLTLENLRHAYPDWSPAARVRLARSMWKHLFLLAFDSLLARRKIHRSNWSKYVQMRGVRHLLATRGQRPMIMVSGHHGNFELGGYVMGLFGFNSYAVARKLDNPYLDRFVQRFRKANRVVIVPKKGGSEQVIRVLQAGGTVGFLADQFAGQAGYWVDFFGRPASAHKAIALLALTHDALLAVGCMRRRPGLLQYELRVAAVTDPRSGRPEVQSPYQLTQWFHAELEKLIRENPDQYWWLHDRWKPNQRTQGQRLAA